VHRQKQRKTKLICTLLFLGASMSANAGLFGFGGTSWKEEVLLHDGSKMVVERSQSRGGRHEIGQAPPVKEHSITFTLPGANKALAWKDEFSEDVGSSNFDLLALHILNGVPYIVASTYGCLSYNKWGRPNPPYILFKFDSKSWQRIQLQELPTEFKSINLVINTSKHEKVLNDVGMVFAERIVEMNGNPRQPEYRTILREPVKSGEGSLVHCDELVFYKGAWVGPGDSIGKRMRDLEKK
jgi:hypothetical protein